jgi:hypothetical protein
MTYTNYSDGNILASSTLNANLNIDRGGEYIAGEAITGGNVVYVKLSDGKAYKSGTGAADTIRASGIANANISSGSSGVIIQHGLYTTTGLTANRTYYLGAAGAISLTPSGVIVGYSQSTTELVVNIIQDDRDAVGTIKSYAKSFTGVPANNLTAFWKECAGAVLSDAESPLNGQTLPDLNTTQRFLRGSGTSGTTGGADSHTHVVQKAGSANNTTFGNDDLNTDTVSNLPAYYEVVWIIKIK